MCIRDSLSALLVLLRQPALAQPDAARGRAGAHVRPRRAAQRALPQGVGGGARAARTLCRQPADDEHARGGRRAAARGGVLPGERVQPVVDTAHARVQAGLRRDRHPLGDGLRGRVHGRADEAARGAPLAADRHAAARPAGGAARARARGGEGAQGGGAHDAVPRAGAAVEVGGETIRRLPLP
eukprot:2788221-Prymnesium_polylepis.1